MIRSIALGSAAADVTATVAAISENGFGESVPLSVLTMTLVVVSLWGLGSALYLLVDRPTPEAVTIESPAAQWPRW